MARAFSAPGKAFLAGCYLVLEPTYNAYVTALSSRMHAVLQHTDSQNSITVSSPQFAEGEWKYAISPDFSVSETTGRRNPFVEAAVATVVQYMAAKNPISAHITVFSDAGYHSQDNTSSKTSSNGGKKFLFHSNPIQDVPKTGLGSSAGLVTVVVTALLAHFTGSVDQNLVHNLAQVAHCYAQKKVGSGFDVATAVYGSIVYRRFSPVSLDELFREENPEIYRKKLVDLANAEWNFTHTPCALPPRIRLLMGDIAGGSETPKLVSKVLQWKKNKPEESTPLYRSLDAANEELMEALTNLHDFHRQNAALYNAAADYFLAISVAEQNGVARKEDYAPFYKLVDAIKHIRANLKKLTVLCGADIEPDSQTALLDRCNMLAGSLGGVVPGAGGFDAISLLVVDSAVEKIKGGEKRSFESVSWLDLHEEAKGVVEVDAKDYEGL